MAAITKSMVTTDHAEIRRWAIALGGKPSTIIRPENAEEKATRICLDFPEDHANGSLKKISWDDWFKQFETAGLALLYQEHTANGERSNFHKVVSRESVDEVEAAVGGKGRSASQRSRHDREVGAVATSRGSETLGQNNPLEGSRKVGRKAAAVDGIVKTAKRLRPAKYFSEQQGPRTGITQREIHHKKASQPSTGLNDQD
jgi:hypothetical protein